MSAQIPNWPRRLTIGDVSSIRRIDKKPSDIGLVFATQDEADFVRWRQLDLKDQILEIEDEDG
jgi:hypothetical protein